MSREPTSLEGFERNIGKQLQSRIKLEMIEITSNVWCQTVANSTNEQKYKTSNLRQFLLTTKFCMEVLNRVVDLFNNTVIL